MLSTAFILMPFHVLPSTAPSLSSFHTKALPRSISLRSLQGNITPKDRHPSLVMKKLEKIYVISINPPYGTSTLSFWMVPFRSPSSSPSPLHFSSSPIGAIVLSSRDTMNKLIYSFIFMVFVFSSESDVADVNFDFQESKWRNFSSPSISLHGEFEFENKLVIHGFVSEFQTHVHFHMLNYFKIRVFVLLFLWSSFPLAMEGKSHPLTLCGFPFDSVGYETGYSKDVTDFGFSLNNQ
ncbi:unnamed protein product [Lactuca virosa]|uniref:Uncharacterized protein n=1 Tax=Lactuca virosa TaxID=75947 RepID=A0AAU9N4F9_9ASTR|nr:unnamed protein product [Lactuca virosa]